MKNKLIIGMLLGLAVLLGGCASDTIAPENNDQDTQTAAQVSKISAEDAYQRMQSGDQLVILDVRTLQEYEEAHIPGAVLLPNEEIGDEMPELLPDPDAEILIYCRSGNRSAQAAAKLLELGYTKLYDFGGINDWPYDTESGAWQGSNGGEAEE